MLIAKYAFSRSFLAAELSDQLVPGLDLVPGIDGQQTDGPRVGHVSPEGPGHWAGPDIDAEWASGPSWTGPGYSYQHPAQETAHWPMMDAAAHGEESEADISAATVAAYRASLDNRRPLSERKLAAMFGRTSRRWGPPPHG
jgi:hypothetical protein